jgi:anti-anti-sigma factor
VKCYEVTKCSKEMRDACFVWNSFRDNPQDMDNAKCWVLKGAYQEETGQQLKKCKQCAYYLAMNRDKGIMSDSDAEIAVITCNETINVERTKALEKIWETLKQHKRFKVILDISQVKNIYSCGLGAVVKIQKEIAAAKGLLVVVAGEGYITDLFTTSRISRILKIVNTQREARDIFESVRKKELESRQKAEESARIAAETAVRAAAEAAKPKERPACYVYFKNHNPKNATTCDECSKKVKPTGQPCWIVDGMIEGISFQYVDEDCEACPYFAEYGGVQEL